MIREYAVSLVWWPGNPSRGVFRVKAYSARDATYQMRVEKRVSTKGAWLRVDKVEPWDGFVERVSPRCSCGADRAATCVAGPGGHPEDAYACDLCCPHVEGQCIPLDPIKLAYETP